MLAARTCSVVPQWWLPDNARCRWDPAAFLACPAAAQARGEDCTSWQPLHDTLCIPYKAAGALPGKSSSSSSTPTRTVSASASSGPLHASRMQHELKLHARRRPELCCWHPGQRSQPLCAPARSHTQAQQTRRHQSAPKEHALEALRVHGAVRARAYPSASARSGTPRRARGESSALAPRAARRAECGGSQAPRTARSPTQRWWPRRWARRPCAGRPAAAASPARAPRALGTAAERPRLRRAREDW